TRVHSGSLRGDLEKLFERLGTRGQGVPPAALVGKGQFSSSVTEVEAELFEYDRTSRLQQVLEVIVGTGSGSPGIVASVLTAALGVVFTAKGASSALRSLAERIELEAKNAPPQASPAPAANAPAKKEAPVPSPAVGHELSGLVVA